MRRLAVPAAALAISLLALAGSACSKSPAAAIASADPVDYGTVRLGTEKDARVRFENAGEGDAALALVLEGDDADLFALQAGALAVPAGKALEVTVRFRPTRTGAVQATLHYTLQGKAGDVELRGEGAGPRIAVTPIPLDFGPTAIGDEQRRTLRIANVGSEPLRLGGITSGGSGGGSWTDRAPSLEQFVAGEFGLEWPPPDFDAAAGIAPGSAVEVAVTLAPAFVGARVAAITIDSNDPLEPEVRVEAAGAAAPCVYELVPPAIYFDSTATEPMEATLVFRASTTAAPGGAANTCVVRGIQLSGGSDAAFTLVAAPSTPRTLHAGEELAPMRVRFAPASPPGGAILRGAVRFDIAGGRPDAEAVRLVAAPGQDCAVLTPPSADFGTRDLCTLDTRTFTFINACASTQTLERIALDSPHWRLQANPGLPLEMAPGAELALDAIFAPFDGGDLQGALDLGLQGRERLYRAALTGHAVTTVSTEQFSVVPRTKVDILVVVDDSPSMAGKKALIEEYLATWFGILDADLLDYHLGVTTGTVDDLREALANGRLLPLTGDGPRVLAHDTPEVAQLFAERVELAFANATAASASAPRKPLRAARLALSDHRLAGENAGFLRDDALLAVVPISDGDDADAAAISELQSFFVGLKGTDRSGDVGFWSVATPQTGLAEVCTYAGGPALRLNAMADMLPGAKVDLCARQWHRVLEAIGHPELTSASHRRLYQLSARAKPSTIALTVDGAAYPATDGASGAARWSYFEPEHRIVFTSAGLPAPGSTVRVTYVRDCAPESAAASAR